MAGQAPPQPPADAGQKQKQKRLQLNFQETAQWEHDEHGEDDIEDFGLSDSELKIVNDSACLSDMPGAHKRRDNCYGVFQTGNTWVTNQGSITNTPMSAVTALRLPLRGENRDISHDYFSLHFKSSHCRAPQQRQGQVCVFVV